MCDCAVDEFAGIGRSLRHRHDRRLHSARVFMQRRWRDVQQHNYCVYRNRRWSAFGPDQYFTLQSGGEFGLTLNYSASSPAGTQVDVKWNFDAAGNLINDAFLQLVGSGSGGFIKVGEELTNAANQTLRPNLACPGRNQRKLHRGSVAACS